MYFNRFIAFGTCLAMAACNGNVRHSDGHREDIHSGEEHIETSETHRDGGSGHPDEISFPEAKAKAAGVRSETVEAGIFHNVIVTGGDVTSAPGDAVTMVANVSGIVSFSETLAAGVAVKEGETVFTIAADGLQEGDPVTRAKIAYETAKAEYERAQKLVSDKIIARKDFEKIKADYETAKIRYEAIAGGNPDGGAAVRSPKNGYLSSFLVNAGDYVTVGQPLATVSGNSRLYLTADVSEKYADQLPLIRNAHFRLQYGDRVYSTEDLGGRLVSYGRNTGEASPYIPVTFVFNRQSGIIPGSYAEIWLVSGERDNVISLPVSALTEEQGVYFVYIKIDADCYRKQAVTTGATDGRRVEILSGVKEGDDVVVEGAMHVKLASSANAIPAHTHNH